MFPLAVPLFILKDFIAMVQFSELHIQTLTDRTESLAYPTKAINQQITVKKFNGESFWLKYFQNHNISQKMRHLFCLVSDILPFESFGMPINLNLRNFGRLYVLTSDEIQNIFHCRLFTTRKAFCIFPLTEAEFEILNRDRSFASKSLPIKRI